MHINSITYSSVHIRIIIVVPILSFFPRPTLVTLDVAVLFFWLTISPHCSNIISYVRLGI